MYAVNRPFSQIITGPKQFVIPVFQRDYSWGQEQCRRMWFDIVNVMDHEEANHFLGSFVYVEDNAGAAFGSWVVIDGQQRVTTLILILIALRDHILETGWEGEEPTVEQIDDYFLKNNHQSGERMYRLALRRRDNDTLRALVDGKDVSEVRDGSELVVDAYDYFRSLLKEPGVDPGVVYRGVYRLEVVDVRLQRRIDNPQMIFESLNSTGVDLAQSDLIRNYLLMGLSQGDQVRLYDDYWSKLEDAFRNAGGGFEEFLRDYMALSQRSTTQIRRDRVYSEFKDFWKVAEAADTAELLVDMLKLGRYYAWFLLPSLADDKELIGPLSMVRDGGLGTTQAALVVRLYDYYGKGWLTRGEFAEAMTLIKSYLARRAVLGLQTRNYWAEFARMAYAVEEDAAFETFKVALSREKGRYAFPSDEDFFAGIQERDLFHLRSCRHILDTLENHDQSEHSPLGEYSIEHIMPQAVSEVEKWKIMLGVDWEEVHRTWLHRLGNLTLVGYERNISMSNLPFEDKKRHPKGFETTAVRLNYYVRKQPEWTAKQMQERGAELAGRAVKIWPYPEADIGLVRDKDVAELRSRSASRDVSSLRMSGPVRGLLESLQGSICLLVDNISVVENVSLCLYDAYGVFFAELLPMANHVRLLIPLAFDEVDDPDGLARDVTAWHWLPNVVHRDCGVFVDIREREQIDGAVRMIGQVAEVGVA